MLQINARHDLGGLSEHLSEASELDANLITDVIGAACRRYPSLGQIEKTARLTQLIQSGAWTDAALAMIDLELPLWQVRRVSRMVAPTARWGCSFANSFSLWCCCVMATSSTRDT